MLKTVILTSFLFFPAIFAQPQNSDSNSPLEDSPKPSTDKTEPLNPLYTIPLAPLTVLAPGTAHYLRGDEKTSDDLFKLGGNSFLVFLSSALVLGASGAADQTTIPFIPLAMGGAAGWLAFSSIDLIGSALDKTTVPAYPSQNDYANSIGIDYTQVPSPVFQDTSYTGYWFKHRGEQNNLEFSYVNADKGDIQIYSLDYGKNIYSRENQYQGFFFHVKVTHEDNPLGFFNMTTMEPTIRLYTDATMFSHGLERILLKAKFGLQQHILQYEENAGEGHETDSSMVGAFETSWVASDLLKPHLGYSHERDSILASQTTGFTGVFYAGTEAHIGGDYFLKFRNYFGGELAWDLSLYSTF